MQANKRISESDRAMICERSEQLRDELYGEHPKIKEDYMTLYERLNTPIADRIRAAEKAAAAEAAEIAAAEKVAALAATKQAARDYFLSLLDKGYSTQQLREAITKAF
jgi:hypothetical protein